MICEMRYTDENIEDWDFRRPLSPAEVALSDEGRFLRERLTYVLRVQEERLLKIKIAVKNGVAEPTEDGEYVVLAHPQHFKEMHCATCLRDYLTSSGRLTNLVGKSLWREWEKYGRIRYDCYRQRWRETTPTCGVRLMPNSPKPPNRPAASSSTRLPGSKRPGIA